MTSPRLLLVDDDPDLGLVVRILARRCGHDLTHHLDAESAWAGLDAARPDLMLLDVNLLGTSGLEFLRRLRASPDHARQAVALFVQPALTQYIAAGWAAGVDYHVSKDLVTQPEAWKQRLDEILAHLHGRASGYSIFIDREQLSAAGLDSLEVPLKSPLLDTLAHGELFRAMMARAGPTGPSAEELRECRLRLIDQVGCLFGRAACETILKEIRKPIRTVTTER
jgi:two-component system, OmpR family, response regulator MtrA